MGDDSTSTSTSTSSSPPRRRWLRRVALTAATVAVVGWMSLVAGLYFGQDRLLYQPRAELGGTPADIGLAFEDVAVPTDDAQTLAAWWIPNPNPRCTVLHFHGNAGNRSHRLPDAGRFYDLGCNVFMVDYRGYGGSSGVPSEGGTYSDARASWKAALEMGADPSSIIVFGRSLGGPIAAYLASQRPAAGLVLESTFESLPALTHELFGYLSFDALVRNEYPTAEHLAGFEGPVLILHSTQDDLIPFGHGQRLAERRPERTRFVELKGDHNHGPSATGAPYLEALRGFVHRVAPGPDGDAVAPSDPHRAN